jgi:hypothetical protein
MSDKFLLTCSCGQVVPVTRSQAGSRVECSCGQPLEVPPLRKLVHLPPAKVTATAEGPIWNLNRGLVFLGAVIALPALAFAGYLYYGLPQLSESNIVEYVDRISPAESWVLWRYYADGIPREATPHTQAMLKGIDDIWRKINLALILAAGGFIVAACGLLIRFDRPQRTRPRLD